MMQIQKLLLRGLIFLLVVSSFTLNAMQGLARVSFILACVFIIVSFFFSGRVFFKSFFFPILFVSFNAFSLLWGGDVDAVVQVSSAVFVGYAIFIGLQAGGNVSSMLWGLAVSAIINIIFSYQGIGILGNVEEGRMEGILGNANALAIFLSFSALAIYFLSSERTVFVKGFVFGLLFFTLFYTGSRKGLLLVGLIASIIYLDYLLRGGGKSKVWRVLIIFVISLALLGVFSQKIGEVLRDVPAVQRAEQLLHGVDKWSAPIRHLMISQGVDLWREKPLAGWGAGGFATHSAFGTYSHNNYVELLSNYGVLGFGFYYAFYVHLFLLGWRFKKEYLPRLGLCIVVMLFILEWGLVSLGDKTTWIFLSVAAYCVFSHERSAVLKVAYDKS